MTGSSPRLTYLVCATPRSGSTLLCDVLTRTGVAGRPQEYWEALPATGLPRQPREYLADVGVVALASLVSPYAVDRDAARRVHAAEGLPFLEVFVDTPVEECARRDPKGLYARARAGELQGMTGVDAPYEAPEAPELVVRTLEEP